MSVASLAFCRTAANALVAAEDAGHHAPSVTLPTLLRGFRQREGLTMQAASALIPVARTVWRTWENQGVVPTPGNLQRLSELLGVTPGEIRVAAGPDKVRQGHACPCGRPHGLAGLRTAAGLSSSELARRLHVSPSTITHWESVSRFRPSADPSGHGRAAQAPPRSPASAKSYITKFESKLENDVKDDGRFMYRVELVPIKGPRSDADLAFTFTRAADLTAEELAAMEKEGKTGKVIVAEKPREVIYKDELRPTPAARAIEAGIPFVFGVYEFTQVYKAHKIRPPVGAAPEACDTTFCRYFPPGKEYLYTPAYIARCIKELQTPEGFKKLVGRDPKRKVTDLASRSKATDTEPASKTTA